MTAPAKKPHGRYKGPLDLAPGAVCGYSTSRPLSGQFARSGQPFVVLNNGLVAEVRDHWTGNATVYQNDPAKQQLWMPVSGNGKPSIAYRTGAESLISVNLISLSEPAFTAFFVSKGRGDLYAVHGGVWDAVGINMQVGSYGHLNIFDPDAEAGGSYAGDYDDDHYYIIDAAIKKELNDYRVNGKSILANYADEYGTILSAPQMLTVSISADAVGAEIQEIMLFTGYMSDADRATIRQNVADYYGATLA